MCELDDGPLTAEEIAELEAGLSDVPYLTCSDLDSGRDCCEHCHRNDDQRLTKLDRMEILQAKHVELILCCNHYQFWHSLSLIERIEIIHNCEQNCRPIELIPLDLNFIRATLMRYEENVERAQELVFSVEKVEQRKYDSYLETHLLLMEEADILRFVSNTDKDYTYITNYQVVALSQRGWKLLNLIRDPEQWRVVRDRCRVNSVATLSNLDRMLLAVVVQL